MLSALIAQVGASSFINLLIGLVIVGAAICLVAWLISAFAPAEFRRPLMGVLAVVVVVGLLYLLAGSGLFGGR